MDDPYQILGVERDASLEQITSRYRALALENHPDKNKGSEQIANERMATLNQAYNVLRNAAKRRRWEYEQDVRSKQSKDSPSNPPGLAIFQT